MVALALRVWGIAFGLPYTYHYDEHFYINTAAKLGAGVINNPPYAPTGLSDLLFGEDVIYYLVGRLAHLFDSARAFEAAFRSDPTVFYLLGRLTSALLGAATVVVEFLTGDLTTNKRIGLAAAAFLAVSFLYVRDAHYAVPDIAMSFFVALAVGLAAVALVGGKRRWLLLAATAGGFAVATKWTALPVALPVGLVALWMERRSSKLAAVRLLLVVSFAFLVGFAVGSPQLLLNPLPYYQEAVGQYGAGQTGGFDAWQVDTVPGWRFYGKTLLYGVGPVLLALGVAGVLRRVIAVVKGADFQSALLLSFPLPYFLLMGPTHHYFARYALPLVPFLALFAAEMLWVVSSWIGRINMQVARGLLVIAVLGCIAQPLSSSIQHDLLLTREDTRTLAAQWIEANIPSGSRIAVDWPIYGPPLATEGSEQAHSGSTYDVVTIGGTGLSDHPASWYRDRGFDYVIASSFIYDIHLVYPQQDAERREFYASLGNEFALVREFRPTASARPVPFIFDEVYGPAISLWDRDRPGPTLKLYRVSKP